MPTGPEVNLNTIRTIIGRALYARRTELQMSQSEVSRRLGYSSHSPYHRQEQGIANPSARAQAKISDVFGMPFEELVERQKELEGVGPYGQIRELKQRIGELAEENELLRKENQALKEQLSIQESADIFIDPSTFPNS